MVAGTVGSITTAAAAVSPDMLAKLWGEFDYRMDICSAGDTLRTSEHSFCMLNFMLSQVF